MERIELKRVFLFKKNGKELRLEDPDPAMEPAKVAVFYSNQYPELLNAAVNGPKYTEDSMTYTLSATMGTKG